MSTDTLTRVTNRTVVELSSDRGGSLDFAAKKEPGPLDFVMSTRKMNGVSIPVMTFSRVPVFRSGTFRDSLGIQNTWTHTHMLEMQSHFSLLRDSGAFEDVLVRAGHGSFFGDDPLKGVIGYVKNLQVEKMKSKADQQEYSVLLADYEILDREAQEKISSGLWKNRSAEIGDFITNDDAVYGPTFVGFAYVDRPAVQNLNSFNAQQTSDPITIITEDSTMTADAGTPAANHATPPTPAPPAAPAAPAQFKLGEKYSSDPSEISAYIATLEGEKAAFTQQVATLSEFRTNALKESRHSAVRALSEGEEAKILPTAVDGLIAFADANLQDQAAFTAWLETYKALPAVGIVGQIPNGTPGAGESRNDGAANQGPDQFTADKQLLADFALMQWSDEKIANTGAFARCKAADPTFTLDQVRATSALGK